MTGTSSPFPLKSYPAALLGGVHFTSINMRFFNLHRICVIIYKTDMYTLVSVLKTIIDFSEKPQGLI